MGFLEFLRKEEWSPYLAGGLAGVLLALSVLVTGKFLGASTSFVRVAGMLEKLFWPQKVAQNAYFMKKAPVVEWQVVMVLGILVGAFISSRMSGDFKFTLVPPLWEERFGFTPLRRALVAFVGGCILLFGARLAGGCPSGHGISGVSQLSLSSMVAMVGFVVGGVLVARALYAGRW